MKRPSKPSTSEIRVLLALVQVHETRGRATFREVADVAGLTVGYVYHVLRRLRDADLVAWDSGRAATLRPLVRRVPA